MLRGALPAAAAALAAGGCRPQSPPAATAETPTQVVQAVQAARAAGRLSEIDRHLPPGAGRRHAPVILAVDQVLAGNRALQTAGAAKFGAAAMLSFDVSSIGNSYGVFSISVKAVRESIDGDRAVVMIQESDFVPLVPVELQRRDGRWLVCPPEPEPGLVERLDKLARTLDDARQKIMKADATYEQLVEAYRYRVLPQIEAIEQADLETQSAARSAEAPTADPGAAP